MDRDEYAEAIHMYLLTGLPLKCTRPRARVVWKVRAVLLLFPLWLHPTQGGTSYISLFVQTLSSDPLDTPLDWVYMATWSISGEKL